MPGQGDYEIHPADAAFREGLDLLEADHHEEALGSFDHVLRLQPDNADAHFHRGIALAALGRHEEGVPSFRRAVTLSPTESAYHTHFGFSLLSAGRRLEAIREFERALDLQPDAYRNRVYKALALAAMKQVDKAVMMLAEVREQHPDDPEVLRHMALMLTSVERFDDAADTAEALLAIQPNRLEGLRVLADVRLRQRRHDEAVRALRQIVAIDPSDAAAWAALIHTAELQRQPAAVVAHATEALAAGVRDARVLVARARVFMRQKRHNRAVTDLRRARDLDPGDGEVWHWLSRAAFGAGRMREALSACDRALKAGGIDDCNALFFKASIHKSLGDLDGELEALLRIQPLGPRDFCVVRAIALNHMSRGRRPAAMEAVERFLALHPDSIEALEACADLAEADDQPGRALWCHRQVLKRQPGAVASWLSYADFLLRQKADDTAATILERAANRFPDDQAVVQRLAESLFAVGRNADCRQRAQAWMDSHESSSRMLALLGLSSHALGLHADAVEAFKAARETESRTEANAAPSFPCLLSEALSLHQLGATADGIALLERHSGLFRKHGRELHRALGGLYEDDGRAERAYTSYARALEASGPADSELHFLLARTAAATGRRAIAVTHLARATELDPSARTRAVADPALRRCLPGLRLRHLGSQIAAHPALAAFAVAAAALALSALAAAFRG